MKTGIQVRKKEWIPAYAGMTSKLAFMGQDGNDRGKDCTTEARRAQRKILVKEKEGKK